MNKEIQIVSKLRFPEFNEKWSFDELQNLSHRVMVGIASAATHAYRDSGVILFRNQNIKEEGLDVSNILYIDEDYEKAHKKKRLKGGDLLTARTGYPGTTSVVPSEYEGAQSFTTLITRPKNKLINSFFLCYYINSEQGQAFFNATKIGGGQKNVNASSLSVMPIPFPSLKEQKKIANCLLALDSLITSEAEKLVNLKDHKKGSLQQLFPANGETKPQYRFPEFKNDGDWEKKELSIALGGKSSQIAKNKLELLENGFPIYGADGFIGFIDSFAQENDYIAIVKDGSGVGNLFYYEGKSSLLGTLNYLFSNNEEEYKTKWLYYLLHTISFKPFIKGSGIPHIYYKDYSKLLVLIPKDPKEQQKIANCLSSADDLIETQKRKIKALKKHKKGLMQQLFPNVNCL